jgi:hypothetical protein
MVHDVPTGVKKPGDGDERVGAESPLRNVCGNRCVRKFPRAEASTQICSASAGNHNRVEFATMWLADERSQRDKDKRNNDGRHEIDDTD